MWKVRKQNTALNGLYMCCSRLQVKVEVPDFLALGQRIPPPPKQLGTWTPKRIVDRITLAACVCVCTSAAREEESEEGCVIVVWVCVRQIQESFSDPMISRASEDFDVFHSTIKLPVPAGVSSQTVCLRAYMFHITEGYIILSAGIAFHLICLGMEIVSEIITSSDVLAQTMAPSLSFQTQFGRY